MAVRGVHRINELPLFSKEWGVLMTLWERLFRRRQREEELDEEVQSHLRMATQERREQGETVEQARASAVREFGNVTLVKEVIREMWG
jgi:hypothetical protein